MENRKRKELELGQQLEQLRKTVTHQMEMVRTESTNQNRLNAVINQKMETMGTKFMELDKIKHNLMSLENG